MKLNDFKQSEQKLDEFRLSSLLGDYGSAAAKKMFGQTGGKSVQSQMALDIFLKDFVDDAVSGLDTGIKSGLIDPNLKTKGTAKPVNPKAVKPAAGQPGAAPAAPAAAPAQGTAPKADTSGAVGKYNQQKQTTQNMNQYIQSAAKTINATQDKAQKVALTKELVNYMADRKGYPEWDNAVATVQQVIKKGNVDPNFANAALGKIKAGQTMAEAWKVFYINKLLEAVQLSWEDVGLTVLKESNSKHYIIAETKFYKLNYIFESIVTEAQSIGDYLKNWYAGYMKGVNYGPNQADVDKLIKQVELTYGQDKGKKALEQLAQMSFSISKGAAPGASDEQEKMKQANASQPASEPAASNTAAAPAASSTAQPAAQSGSQPNSHQMAAKIQQLLTQLSKVDAKVYNDLIKSLQPAQVKPAQQPAGQFQDRPAAQPGASAGLVAESNKKIGKIKTK
jgi:hypothetical protein